MIEIKTEIPKEDTGRFLSAITDTIRPFTEGRGLKADQIRLQREDVLLEIAKKARKRADIEIADIHPVPTKLMIPFLEKASLEDVDSNMQDRWAALLVSASKHYQSKHLTFVDILSRLSSEELEILEKVCLSYKRFPELSYPGGHIDGNQRLIVAQAPMLVSKQSLDNQDKAKKLYDTFINSPAIAALQYSKILYATVKMDKGRFYFYSEYADSRESLEILQRERLIEFERLKLQDIDVEVGYFDVTPLGVKFVDSCSPKAADIKNKKQNPKIVSS